MKKFLQIVFYGVFALAFAWVSLQLFFQRETEGFLASLFSVSEVLVSEESVAVMMPEEILSLDPSDLTPAVWQRTANVYEALVATDGDLSFGPGLALSFGRVSPLVWEFRLRPDVKFHDGSGFDIEDVLFSFGLEERDFEVEKIDEMNLRIKTKRPDPLLLAKVSRVLIVSSEDEMTGTGAYRLMASEKGEMRFERFKDYWGNLPYFREVRLLVATNKNERVNRFVAGEADLLTFVPFDAAEFLRGEGFELLALPSLEVQFLLFNFDSELFRDLQKRAAFSAAIDKDDLMAAVGGFARPSAQFLSSGVFGFNPDLKDASFDLAAAKELAEESGLKGETISVHLPLGLSVLGEHIRLQMKEVGVNALISYLDGEDLLKSFAEKKADIYFLGFKGDSGDGGDFLADIVAEDAAYNVGSFRDSEVNDLIEAAREELVASERLEILRRVFALLDQRVFGVPLFEYESLYALGDLQFEPRIDGFINFKELKR